MEPPTKVSSLPTIVTDIVASGNSRALYHYLIQQDADILSNIIEYLGPPVALLNNIKYCINMKRSYTSSYFKKKQKRSFSTSRTY